MNELKPCPFCFGQADQSHASGPVNCVDCGASAPCADSWNTRAAPTMKAWEWVESIGTKGETILTVKAFGACATSNEIGWSAQADGKFLGYHFQVEIAKAACVAYVEGKLKEWLI